MMRLRRLDLTRFGHFTDGSLDFGAAAQGKADFHIVYGPNEAGKTTVMEAYLRLVYGFPMRDVYSFRHPLNTLQVGGLVEINGIGTELVRVKKPANSLQDRHGDVIPESVVQACLGGIVQDDYRKLFCLDDATIEAGGDEITNSKGDIGRLLFAAAAGIGDLSGVLDLVAARAETFYKKNASKTTFAGLKRRLEELAGEIKTHDVSASAFRSLHVGLDVAKDAETKIRSTKDALEWRKSQLAALIAAHPVAAELCEADEALAPIRHYPIALDIDPEKLIEMVSARVALEAEHDHHAATIEHAQQSLSTLFLNPLIIGHRDEILAIDRDRGRMEGALADLPIRIAERETVLTEMRTKIQDMGFDPGDDPTRFVLPEHKLHALERAHKGWSDAETKLAGAIDEAGLAQSNFQSSEKQLADAKAAATIGPEVDEIFQRFDAQTCVDDYRSTQQQVDNARTKVTRCLRDLARGSVSFDSVPSVSLTVRQAEQLALDIHTADQQFQRCGDAERTASGKLAKARARMEILRSSAGLVTDAEAQLRRVERDARWTSHRAALDAATAEHFEAAMQLDDQTTTLRQAQAGKIADYQQACIVVSEAETDFQTAERQLKEAGEARAALNAVRMAQLASLGLPDLSAPDLVDWVRQRDVAISAREDLQAAEDATTSARTAAENLHQALAVLSGTQGSKDLSSLFRRAQIKAGERKQQLADLKAKSDGHAKETGTLTMRRAAMQKARTECDKAADDWQTMANSALPAGHATESLRYVLSGLRGLREISEKLVGLTRQIDGMNRDRDAFMARVTPLAALVGAPDTQPALEIFRAVHAAVADAEEAANLHKKLTDAIVESEKAQVTAISTLTIQDNQIRKLAEAFSSDIETETLQDLRDAVNRGKQAIDLRATIAKLTTALVAGLGVRTRADAETALAAMPLDAARAEFATVNDELPGVNTAFEAAIARRSTARDALYRVQGDADVAERVAKQRTIEMEMQDGTMRYLEDRFSQMLAERAIRRYRDTHRGGMLVATEAAFHTLTNGSYAGLSTQADGASEVLLATRSTDGSAKQVSEMSKGTKFQLYLALRAAAYEQVAAGGTILPFFCDDIFETFDEPRTTAACGLMRQIGQRGQAIYLTHHRHVVEIAQQLCGDDVKVHDLAV